MRRTPLKNSWSWFGLVALLTVRVSFAPQAPALTGLVTSTDNQKPLPGARVQVYAQLDPEAARERHAKGDPIGEPLARAMTDSDGRFKMPAPAGQRLVVVVQAPGRARSFLPEPILISGVTERDVGQLELPPGHRLTGKVIDTAGKPVAGARVIALAPRRRARGGGAGFARRMSLESNLPPFPDVTRSAADGTFTLDSLPDRPVTLRAWADGLAPGLIENVPAGAGVTVRLGPGHSIAGKVVAPDGKTAVAGAQVVAGDDGWDGVTRSGADGTFRLENQREGPASLVACLNATSSLLAPSAPIHLSLPAAAQKSALLLKLRPGGLVRGRAIDSETRKPMPGVAITLDAPGEDEPRPGVTDARGEVLFSGVPLGSIRARAQADGYLATELNDTPLAADQTREWTAAMRPGASIEGTVRDASGHPIQGARVSISGPPPFSMPVRLPLFFPIGVDPVTTDARGRFAIEKLPSRDELKVSVQSDGFAPWEMAGIKLRPGERRAGMEVLLDAGAILSGRLVTADHQPVAAASVKASRRQESGPGGMVIRIDAGPGRRGASGLGAEELPAVESGPDGLFRVRGARPGVWSLEVSARGFAPRSVGGLKLETSTPVLDAGDILLEPGAALRGRVVTAAGEPVPYARGAVRKELSVVSTFNTGANGEFTTDELVPGEAVTLTVDADGYAAAEKNGLTPPLDDMVVTLVASSRVAGQVLDRETRRPVPDFSIAMSRSRGGGGGGMRMNVAIAGPETPFHSEDGRFVIEDVDPGKMSVAARAPGYKESALRDVDVPEGRDLEGLVFTLDRSATVSGRVLDDRGLPLSGVAVRKKETSGGMGFVIGGPGGGSEASTDGDGEFTLFGLDRGALTLSFNHPEYEPAERDIDTSRDIEGLRVTLSRGATLSGTVLHEESGSPVAGASVSAVAAGVDRFGGGRSVTTGPDGAFTLDAVPPGRYTLRAEATGLSGASIDNVVVSPGAALPQYELRMGGGVTLSGTITGVKETDMPQFTVRAVAAAGGFGGFGGFGTTAPVDAGGHFEIKGLTAGNLTLIAGSGLFGGRSVTKTVQIPDDTPLFETILEFPHGSTVEGNVTRGGRPVDGANVIFLHEVNRSRATATADAAGHYVAEDLDDGDYSVDVVQFSSGISHSTRVSVKADRRFDIELPLARIAGTVKDSGTGLPLDGAVVSVKKESAAQPAAGTAFLFRNEARTDATGAYTIDGLDEGTYTLTARKDGYGYEPRVVTIAPTVQPDDVPFELSRVDAFSFRALDSSSGLPLRSLNALVMVGGGDPLAPNGSGATSVFREQISADAAGLFRLDSLQPGRYRIVLGGQNLATETLDDVKVPAPETTISMRTGGTVEVTADSLKTGQTGKAVLLDPSGRPVYLNPYFVEPTFVLRPGASATLTDVKPGTYRIRASMPGGGIAEKPVEVAEGKTTRIAIP